MPKEFWKCCIKTYFAFQPGNWGYCSPDCETQEAPEIVEEVTDDFIEGQVPDDDKFLDGYDATVLPAPNDTENDCGTAIARFSQEANGSDARKGEYPFIAVIGTKPFDEVIYGCNGALINRRYVLISATCRNKKFPIVEVLLGAYDYKVDAECVNSNKEEDGCLTGALSKTNKSLI